MHKKLLIFVAALMIAATFIPANAQTRRPIRKKPVAKRPTVLTTGAVKTSSGLIYLITQKGTGTQPKVGQTVVVHYTGTLTNGTKFDSSRDRGTPFEFLLGKGRVIKGWDEGIGRMHVGDQAVFVIPSSIAYGPGGRGPIPPNATLIFIVELVDVKD